jgi:hypothetical protein
LPRRRSNKRGIRGTRLNFGVIFNAVLRAIEEQGPQPQVEILVQLNVPEDEEEAPEPQQQQEVDDEAAKPPDQSKTPIMCKFLYFFSSLFVLTFFLVPAKKCDSCGCACVCNCHRVCMECICDCHSP